jgi:hypothetical protein
MKLIVALSALVLSASTALAGGYYGSTGVYYDDLDIYDPVPSVVGRVRAAASAGLSCAADSLCRWTSAGAVLWALWLWVLATAVASTGCGGPIMGRAVSTGCAAPIMGHVASTGCAGRRTGRRLLDEGKERRRPPTRIRDRRRHPLGPASLRRKVRP